MAGFPGESPLVIRNEMHHVWLVQRLEAPRDPNPFSFGGGYKNGGLSDAGMAMIRNIFSFDYMGAAEFEFGAVPQALHFLARQGHGEKNLVTGTVTFPEGNVYYICPKEYEVDVKGYIGVWARYPYGTKDGKGRTKESVRLYEALRKQKYCDTLGWLELDNGFFFTIDEDMFNKTKELFGCATDSSKQ
jgi:hypothetical protein